MIVVIVVSATMLLGLWIGYGWGWRVGFDRCRMIFIRPWQDSALLSLSPEQADEVRALLDSYKEEGDE